MTSHPEFRIPKYEDLICFAREALGLSESISIELFPLEGRGSDRTFSRLKWNQKDSAILIHYDPNRVENKYYADIAAFLHDIEVPVPQLIRHDLIRCLIIMEDLGDQDLWSFLKPPGKFDKPSIKGHLSSRIDFIPSPERASLQTV